jgi:hypothetical protein
VDCGRLGRSFSTEGEKRGWTVGGWGDPSVQEERKEGGLEEAGAILQYRRREERADFGRLWRSFGTGGEKREWTAGGWDDPSVQEERREGRLWEAGEILRYRRREERVDCRRLGRSFCTGGEERGWTAGGCGDPLVQEERREGELQEAVEILQYRRKEERADSGRLGRSFSTGGEKRGWTAGSWGDPSVHLQES